MATENNAHTRGKALLRAAVAAWARGKEVNVKVRLTGEQVQALSNVMSATRKFEESLSREESVPRLVSLLENKKIAARNFYAATGVIWPL